jgi:opacity protein-like surface antigen
MRKRGRNCFRVRINRKTKPENYVMLRKLLIAGAIALLATPAMAQSPTLYFGIHGGKQMTSTELTNTGATFSLDGLSGNGYVAGAHVGADLQLPSSPVFVGVFAGADWGNSDFTLTAGPIAFTAGIGNSYYAGARAGVVVHGTKVYALAAWRQSEWSASVKGITLDDPRGWDLGLGIDVPIAKNVSLGLEGVSTQYQKAEFMVGAPPAASGLHAQIDSVTVMARLNFAIGGQSSIFDDAGAAPAKSRACDPKLGCK